MWWFPRQGYLYIYICAMLENNLCRFRRGRHGCCVRYHERDLNRVMWVDDGRFSGGEGKVIFRQHGRDGSRATLEDDVLRFFQDLKR